MTRKQKRTIHVCKILQSNPSPPGEWFRSFGSDETLAVLMRYFQVPLYRRSQLLHAIESSPANPLAGPPAKPEFQHTESRTTVRNVVQVKTSVAFAPVVDQLTFVSGVVVHNHVQGQIVRSLFFYLI